MADAARILGVHPQTVRKWTREGLLECSWTPGGERRFLVSDLTAFARRHKQPARHKARATP